MRIIASVPGKVIVCGEHSVVYGRLALCSSIGLKTLVTLSYSAHNEHRNNEISFEVPTLVLSVKVKSADYESFFDLPLSYSLENVASDFDVLSTHFKSFLDDITGNSVIATKVFLYLLGGILRKHVEAVQAFGGFKVLVEGDLPLSSGLGSSASLASGIAAVFECFARKVRSVDDEMRKSVNQWAFQAEQFAHGKASGLDNFTVVYGGLVEAQNGHFAKSLLPSSSLEDFTLIFIDSGVPKSTRHTVANVRSFVERFPQLGNRLFDAIENVASDVRQCLLAEEEKSVRAASIQRLIGVNHCLLKALGVSHAVLDDIVALCERFGVGAKLTGGGGGGMVLVMADAASEAGKLQQLQAELIRRGFKSFTTHMTNTGLELFYNENGEK